MGHSSQSVLRTSVKLLELFAGYEFCQLGQLFGKQLDEVVDGYNACQG